MVESCASRQSQAPRLAATLGHVLERARPDSLNECGAPPPPKRWSEQWRFETTSPRTVRGVDLAATGGSPVMLIQEPDEPGRKGGDSRHDGPGTRAQPGLCCIILQKSASTSASTSATASTLRRRVHSRSSTSDGTQTGWKRVKPIHFASDAAGFGRFQRYLDRHSTRSSRLFDPSRADRQLRADGAAVPIGQEATGFSRLKTEPSRTTGRRSSAARRRPTTPMPD